MKIFKNYCRNIERVEILKFRRISLNQEICNTLEIRKYENSKNLNTRRKNKTSSGIIESRKFQKLRNFQGICKIY